MLITEIKSELQHDKSIFMHKNKVNYIGKKVLHSCRNLLASQYPSSGVLQMGSGCK